MSRNLHGLEMILGVTFSVVIVTGIFIYIKISSPDKGVNKYDSRRKN